MRDDSHEPATKGDLNLMRAEMRSDFAVMIRSEIREALRPITITLAHHTAELADIRGHIKDKMVTRDEFHSRLDDHEKRIIALEEKRA